jgi:formylglycine-generating enzyme required for sulfatase activity
MAGNVREWVADWFDPRGPSDGSLDPRGPAHGSKRVVRGGGWRDDGSGLTTFFRSALPPEERGVDLGFRCVHKGE